MENEKFEDGANELARVGGHFAAANVIGSIVGMVALVGTAIMVAKAINK